MVTGWLITGGSSGLGLSLGRAVLANDKTAVLTTRSIEKARSTAPDVEENGGHWLEIDFSDPKLEGIIKDAVIKYDLGVLVNNAGYSLAGPVEDCSPEAIRTQYEANLIGPIRLIQAVIPIFRERKSGTIANIGSSVSYSGMPSISVYASTKAALRIVTNGLTAELAPFGIRVYMFEPGRFRTNFGSHGVFASPDPQGFNKHYQGTVVDQILTFLKSAPPASGNPDEAALRMWEVVTGTGMGGGFAEVPRIPLGSDAVDSMGETGKEWSDLAEKTAQIARSTDFKE